MQLFINPAKRSKLTIAALSLLLIVSGFPADRPTSASAKHGAGTAAVTREYSPQAERLVAEMLPGTDPAVLAAQSGGLLVRTGPLNYSALEFYPEDKAHREEIRQSVMRSGGVLGAEWSKTYTIDREEVLNPDSLETAGTAASVTVSDPEYILQWGVGKVRANQVWPEGATGEGMIVAVIDTGVDLTHPDLIDPASDKNNIVRGYNAITRSSRPGAAQDDNGHGTSVAGVIAALKNGKGIVGVAYDAKIMPIKAMNKEGEGEDSIIADGIIWAVDNGAKIINMSIGSGQQTKILDDALKYAADRGVILVGASGNSKGYSDLQAGTSQGTKGSGVAFPGANPHVIAVSAVDRSDNITDFSLTGPEVRLSAPGSRILTNHWDAEGRTGVASATGTSIAAPFVSAAAALLWSRYPRLAGTDIQQALLQAAYDRGAEGRDDQYGYGRLDIYRALKSLEQSVLLSSPASVGWEGGKVYLGASAEEPDAVLSVPFGAFSLPVDNNGIDKKMLVSLNRTASPGEFPAGIIPAGEAVAVNPWGEDPAEKVLSLSLRLDRQEPDPALEDSRIAYLYKWSATRWIRVGGGMATSSLAVRAAIYEPGIYRAGWSAEPETDRIAGIDRIHTALEIAGYAFPTGADAVIIARADDFPDALAGAPLAYKHQAPILLTYPDSLPPEVYRMVRELAPRRIFILGGTGAVSAGVETQLNNISHVTRISGDDRYGTAAAAAALLGTKGQAVVVSGTNFPDAMAAASHAAVQGKPILLTAKDSLGKETEDALRRHSVTATEVIGGSGVIAEQVVRKLPHPRRISGQNRYATSAGVMTVHKPAGRIFFVATGLNYPDALTGGVLAAANAANIMLLPPSGLTPEQRAVLASIRGSKIIALGGEAVIAEDQLQQIKMLVNF